MGSPATAAQKSLPFRDDINGLRALAVTLVLLFHFQIPGVSQGWIGVDVFFAVSGYLMTAIILGQLERHSFTLLSFYRSRVRRIVPAMVFLVAALLAFGWFWMVASDYREFCAEAISALLFYSNVRFADQVGYFDTGAEDKWLLHTWTLSVEWQFYILFPLLLILLWRFAPRSIKIVLPVLLAGSLIRAIVLGLESPSDAFYLFPPRAWELLAGSLVFVFRKPIAAWTERLPIRLDLIGYPLIVLSGVLSLGDFWPVQILPAVGGALLVLIANRQGSLVNANPVSMALGRWSYSIYLWHWPLLVGSLYFGYALEPSTAAILIAASIALGAFSYELVEQPFRRKPVSVRPRIIALTAGWGLALLFAFVLKTTDGLPGRLSPEIAAMEKQAIVNEVGRSGSLFRYCGWDKDAKTLVGCPLGLADTEPSVAVWGDSHANAYAPGIGDALQRSGLAGEMFYRNQCRPLQDLEVARGRATRDCTAFNAAALKQIASDPKIDTVVIVASWANDLLPDGYGGQPPTRFGGEALRSPEERRKAYAARMTSDFCQLERMGKRVIVMGPLPDFGVDVPMSMARSTLLKGHTVVPEVPFSEHRKRNGLVIAALEKAHQACGIEIVEPTEVLCQDGVCSGARENVPLYSDHGHPSPYASRLVAPKLEALLKKDSTD